MKFIYKINYDIDKDYYFQTESLAFKFLNEKISKRRNNGDRDVYDDITEKKINKLVDNKKWFKVAPYFNFWVFKIPVNSNTKKARAVYSLSNNYLK